MRVIVVWMEMNSDTVGMDHIDDRLNTPYVATQSMPLARDTRARFPWRFPSLSFRMSVDAP